MTAEHAAIVPPAPSPLEALARRAERHRDPFVARGMARLLRRLAKHPPAVAVRLATDCCAAWDGVDSVLAELWAEAACVVAAAGQVPS